MVNGFGTEKFSLVCTSLELFFIRPNSIHQETNCFPERKLS